MSSVHLSKNSIYGRTRNIVMPRFDAPSKKGFSVKPARQSGEAVGSHQRESQRCQTPGWPGRGNFLASICLRCVVWEELMPLLSQHCGIHSCSSVEWNGLFNRSADDPTLSCNLIKEVSAVLLPNCECKFQQFKLN